MTQQNTMAHIDEIVAAEREAESLVASAFNQREEKITAAKAEIAKADQTATAAREEKSQETIASARQAAEKQALAIRAEADAEAERITNIDDARIAAVATSAATQLFE